VADLLFSFNALLLVQVQTRNETLEKIEFPKQSSVSPVFKFSAGNTEKVKKAISTLGSMCFVR